MFENWTFEVTTNCCWLSHFIPNRNLFFDRAEYIINQSKRNKDLFALFFIDLDNFEYINDQYGHDVGDKYLKIISQRLCECVRESDTVSRIGGDEFTIVLSKIQRIKDISVFCNRILNQEFNNIVVFASPTKLPSLKSFIVDSIGEKKFSSYTCVQHEQTASMAARLYNYGPPNTETNHILEYDGTSWSKLSTTCAQSIAAPACGKFGTTNAGVVFGGQPPHSNATEEWTRSTTVRTVDSST